MSVHTKLPGLDHAITRLTQFVGGTPRSVHFVNEQKRTMATYRVRPSKPVAIVGAIGGAVILIAGLFMVGTGGKNGWFSWLWLAFGIAIICFNLWAAFAKNGSVQTISSDDGPPMRPGMQVTKE